MCQSFPGALFGNVDMSVVTRCRGVRNTDVVAGQLRLTKIHLGFGDHVIRNTEMSVILNQDLLQFTFNTLIFVICLRDACARSTE